MGGAQTVKWFFRHPNLGYTSGVLKYYLRKSGHTKCPRLLRSDWILSFVRVVTTNPTLQAMRPQTIIHFTPLVGKETFFTFPSSFPEILHILPWGRENVTALKPIFCNYTNFAMSYVHMIPGVETRLEFLFVCM
jgi:hypothetical protein